MSGALKPGVRVRVIRVNHLHEYHPGDRGTVLSQSGCPDNGSGACYIVMMDGADGEDFAVLYEGEIEPDV
jgi:hypothetical protein